MFVCFELYSCVLYYATMLIGRTIAIWPPNDGTFRDSDGVEYGPFSGPELRNLVDVGRVRRETPVRTDASSGSIAASAVKGLFPGWESDAPGPHSSEQAHESGGRPGLGSGVTPRRPTKEVQLEEIDVGGYPGHCTTSRARHQQRPGHRRAWSPGSWAGRSSRSSAQAAAIITGHIAMGQIERSDGREDGKILAVIGLVLGYIEAALLAAVTISLFLLGISIAGLLSFLFQQVEREGRRREMNPPRVERPRAVAPIAPPRNDPGDRPREVPKALGGEVDRAKSDDTMGAGGAEGPATRIVAIPGKRPKDPRLSCSAHGT